MAETRANLGAAAPEMEVDDDMPNLLSFNIHGGFEFVLATVALVLQELLGKMKMMTLSLYARISDGDTKCILGAMGLHDDISYDTTEDDLDTRKDMSRNNADEDDLSTRKDLFC